MGFLDLFRPSWRHSDAAVRAEAVRRLRKDDVPILAKVARLDPAVDIRRLAVKKLEDPSVLREIAASDPDDSLRRAAEERAQGLLLAVAMAPDAVRALAALGELGAPHDLVALAKRAAEVSVRQAALARVTDEAQLADIGRRAEDETIRRAAIARVTSPALLAAIAREETVKGIALEIVARVTDHAALDDLAKKAAVKAARNAAAARAGQLAAARKEPPADSADKIRRARQVQLCRIVEAAQGRKDPAAAAESVRAAEEEWATLGIREGEESVSGRFMRLCAAFHARVKPVAKRSTPTERVRSVAAPAEEPRPAALTPAPPPVAVPAAPSLADRLQALSLELEQLRGAPRGAEERLAAIDEEWTRVDGKLPTPEEAAADSSPEAVLRLSFARARAEVSAKVQEKRAQREAREAESIDFVTRTAERLECLFEAVDLRPVEKALRDVRKAWDAEGSLPNTVRSALVERLRTAQDKLGTHLSDLRDAESWRRWANVPKLEELCAKAEALAEVLLEVTDKRRAPAELRALMAEWKAVGAVPKEKSDVLWARFKQACDTGYERCKDFFVELDTERAANLVKKEDLCVQAEALIESTSYAETTDKLRSLQDTWQAIGPVPKEQSDAVWKRFRSACDAFFEKKKAHFQVLDEDRQANLQKKEQLCERMDSLASALPSPENADKVKALQAEWKETGQVPKEQSDAIWKRFRDAADRFFAARKAAFAKQDEEREANAKKKEALCVRAEALAAIEDREAAMAEAKEAQAAWKKIGHVPKEKSEPLWRRFRAACDAVFAEPLPTPVDAALLDTSGFTNRLPLEGLMQALGSPTTEPVLTGDTPPPTAEAPAEPEGATKTATEEVQE